MTEMFLGPYLLSSVSVVGLLLMYPIQLFVGDAAQHKMGHAPGTPALGGVTDFAFRAERAASNSLENMPFMILMMIMAVCFAAPVGLANFLAISALVLRLVHMVAYYANWPDLRGLSWLAGVLVMLIMAGSLAFAAAASLVG